AGGGDHVGDAVAVDVGGRHPHPARERGIEGPEAGQRGGVGAADDVHFGGAGAGPGDDVGVAVAVDVPGGHVQAAPVSRVEGQEVVDLLVGHAVVDADARGGARAGGREDVRVA